VRLSGKRVAVLAEAQYEDLELWYPLLRLREEGAEVKVVGTGSAPSYESKHGYPVTADLAADETNADDFDAVVVPGGFAPDRMRRYPAVLNLVKGLWQQGKVVAAICHGPWVLVSAGVLDGRKATSFYAIKDDVINAGATWVDEPVTVDGTLVTSRVPGDLPEFMRTVIDLLA
jgi:protease I